MKSGSVKTLAVFFVLGALLAPPVLAAGERDRERVTTEGEGEAEIREQDLSLARGEALEDALQKAFENALVEILPLGLSLTGQRDVMDQLATRLRRYLLQYRVLSEMPALQVFFVNVEATFSVPLIREDLVTLGIAWTDEIAGEPIVLFLRIKGVSSVRSYQELVQVFREMSYVNTATPYEVFGKSMVLRLEYDRTLEDLVESISAWRSEEYAFTVEQVNDLEITVLLATLSDQGMY